MPVEQVAGSGWNRWPDVHGIGGRITVVRAGPGVMTIEVGSDLLLRIPGDVAVDRAAALVRALRGAS